MRFGFGQVSKTGENKIAELFDIQQGKGQNAQQFRQQIISAVDFYKNVQQKEKQILETEIKVDLEKAIYQIIGYDEQLIKSMKSRGLMTKQFPMKTEKLAKDLFKFTMQNTPKTYVDTSGNIWELKRE